LSKLTLNTGAPLEKATWFADLILPVPIARYFTYRLPQDLNSSLKVGCRVIVQFGSKKILTGIVAGIHQQPPQNYEAKYILEQLEIDPVVQVVQLSLFDWIATYYMCTIGEVLNVALPSGLKLSIFEIAPLESYLPATCKSGFGKRK